MDAKYSKKDVAASRLAPRERLMAAAEALFYEEGVNTVGIDKIIERAGVAKASLYGHFKGKEELVGAYLAARLEARQARISAAMAAHDNPRDKLLAVFDLMAEIFADPGYRGCAFARASAEVRDDSSGRQICDQSRRWIRGLFTDLAAQAGASDAPLVGQQLQMIYDGAALSAQMNRDPLAASTARAGAALLLDAACR